MFEVCKDAIQMILIACLVFVSWIVGLVSERLWAITSDDAHCTNTFPCKQGFALHSEFVMFFIKYHKANSLKKTLKKHPKSKENLSKSIKKASKMKPETRLWALRSQNRLQDVSDFDSFWKSRSIKNLYKSQPNLDDILKSLRIDMIVIVMEWIKSL